MTRLCLISLAILSAARLPAQEVNQDALTIQDFEKRVSDYMKLRKTASAAASHLKPTDSPGKITQDQHTLRARIRAARPLAKQGDIFTPEIQAEFRRLIGIAMSGSNASRIHQSLKRAEPVRPPFRINGEYPASVPLQSTPEMSGEQL